MRSHLCSTFIQKRFITSFLWRHIGPNENEIQTMLDKVEITDTDELIKKTIPNNLLMEKFRLGDSMSPHSLITLFEELSEKNNTEKTYFGQGYYPTITPSFIMRNLLGNPAWYSPYTPYQSEISQGRLESLYNYQLMITELTKLPISNSSLLDEGSAASEAMIMCYNILGGKKKDFIVDPFVFKQTMDVIYTIAEPLGINIIVCDHKNITNEILEKSFGVLIQYPNSVGDVNNFTDYTYLVSKIRESGSRLITATDIMALSLIKSPGELGADVAIGNCQRLGIPMYFGGPHAAFISAKKEFIRLFPGKIVAKSVDVHSNKTYRLAAQTREQHIKREKATSNICTAQCLLANVSAMYAIYHGPKGIKDIAKNINKNAAILEKTLSNNGFEIVNTSFFDTITVTHPSKAKLRTAMNKNIFKNNTDGSITISIDETVTLKDVRYILKQFGILHISNYYYTDSENYTSMLRSDEFMTQPIFNINKSETNLLRYIKRLEEKDLSLIHSMIPLGSCTMKLNSSASLTSLAMNGFKNLHPYSPDENAQGYLEILKELTHFLTKISGMDTTCLQPNSGSQGEYTGLRMIKKYIDDKYGKDNDRNICLIPESAHGTNPASASKAGLKVIVIKTKNGQIDVDDLNNKIKLNDNKICCLMITYPSTYGFFEGNIIEICDIIHKSGGQIYLGK